MYHSITPGKATPDSRWAVSEQSFVEQLSLLQDLGWHTALVGDLREPCRFGNKTVILTFDDGFADNYSHAFHHLVTRGMKASWFVVTGNVGTMSSWTDSDVPARKMLDRQQLIEMHVAGMEIGGHTRTHARLTKEANHQAKEEVLGCKEDLESILQNEVRTFAYPYGLHNSDVEGAVRRAGFEVACTTRTGWAGSDTNLLRVRRVAIFAEDSLSMFARKIAFADTDIGWAKMRQYFFSRIKNRLIGGC